MASLVPDFGSIPTQLMSYPVGAVGGAAAAYFFQEEIAGFRQRYRWALPVMGAMAGIGTVYVFYGGRPVLG